MWDKIKDQNKVKEILRNIFLSGKISHSYIFYGPEGTGKDAAAIEFAKLLNCDNPLNGNEACDECKNCTEISSFRSPLFKFITALPTGKSESDDDSNPLEKLDREDFIAYLSETELKVSDNYHKIIIPKANDIRISSIRQIKRDIYFTGRAGKKKVFLISESQKMNLQSANSLLKILEEPPDNSVIILTTSGLNTLLPTISGRCHKIKFNPLPYEEILKYIYEKFPGADKKESEFFAQLSEGSITKCNDILGKNYTELRSKILDFLTSVITGQNIKLGSEIDFVTLKKDKERLRQFLILLAVWFRDLTAFGYGAENIVINKDKNDRLKKFTENFHSENYKIINLIEEAHRDIDSNIIPELILYNLSFNIKFLIHRKQLTS